MPALVVVEIAGVKATARLAGAAFAPIGGQQVEAVAGDLLFPHVGGDEVELGMAHPRARRLLVAQRPGGMHRWQAGEADEVPHCFGWGWAVDEKEAADVAARKAHAVAKVQIHRKSAVGKEAKALCREHPGHEVVTLPRLPVMDA